MNCSIEDLEIKGFGPSPVHGDNFHIVDIWFEYFSMDDEFWDIRLRLCGEYNGQYKYRDIDFDELRPEFRVEIKEAMYKKIREESDY